ncbi:hypothetical protein P4E94_03655 [Pontiellaceae bacterium B12219]|nr:hypothetical protein [Pontiellaceae bacterium B12219]
MKMLLKILCIGLLFALPTFGKDYRFQTLETANELFRSATNSAGYAEAAKQYELLVEEDGIRNGSVFYNLGNSWFMAGDAGRAILNYRRAEQYMPNNPDLKHNLKTALALRTDLIPEKEPHPVVAKLFGWHLNTSPRFRGMCFAVSWMVLWGSWFWLLRAPRKEVRITVAASGLVSVLLLGSLITDTVLKYSAEPGVITAKEVVARKGDGTMYAPTFLDPLHSGTEFQCLEERGDWLHIQLADGQACWIPKNAGEKVALAGE